MLVVILKVPEGSTEAKGGNVEIRMMVEGLTLDEVDKLGDAIHNFAVEMNRHEKISAYQLEDSVSN